MRNNVGECWGRGGTRTHARGIQNRSRTHSIYSTQLYIGMAEEASDEEYEDVAHKQVT